LNEKIIDMKNKFLKFTAALIAVFVFNACTLEKVVDPNFPGVESLAGNATKSQLNNLAIGEFSLARNGMGTYLQVTGTIGKELFNFNLTESRWLTELNGLRPIDNSAFYNGATTGFGLPVRQANILLAAADKTTLATAEEKAGYKGIANTFKGLAYLLMLNAQYQSGVRLSVEDPFKPSKPVSYIESLAGIIGFLDAGAASLDAAGSAFPVTFPTGFAGFNTPATFKQFNRAIALRVAIYQKDWAKAATILPQTFISETGSLTAGPVNTYNAALPDIANPLVNVSSATIVAVEKIFNDIEAGDDRINKVVLVDPALSYSSGLPSAYLSKWKSNIYNASTSTSIPIIRNEELILIKAEIAANQNNLPEATRVINLIRVAHGLTGVALFASADAAITAILKERLYSLWYEGHRWVDMRRYDRIDQIEIPVIGMKVLQQLERPNAEVNWDIANP